jgi:hypothetical protein
VARLRAFADAGASRAYLQVLDLDDLELLAAEVALSCLVLQPEFVTWRVRGGQGR